MNHLPALTWFIFFAVKSCRKLVRSGNLFYIFILIFFRFFCFVIDVDFVLLFNVTIATIIVDIAVLDIITWALFAITVLLVVSLSLSMLFFYHHCCCFHYYCRHFDIFHFITDSISGIILIVMITIKTISTDCIILVISVIIPVIILSYCLSYRYHFRYNHIKIIITIRIIYYSHHSHHPPSHHIQYITRGYESQYLQMFAKKNKTNLNNWITDTTDQS